MDSHLIIIKDFIHELKVIQENSNKKGYLDGIFPSIRFHPNVPYKREDENIFISATIVFILQENLTFLKTLGLEDDVKKIITNVTKNYLHFKNFKGLDTYNFFKTNPMDFFPNGKIMRHFKFFKLADDTDDTAYIYLTTSKTQKQNEWLHHKLSIHANGHKKWISHAPKNYNKLKAYSVYFGEKMHIELDFCVLTNIVLWVEKNKLKHSIHDIDSIEFIRKVILSRDYIKIPHIVSPCYPSTSQICYHFARLLHKTNIDKLNLIKPSFVEDIRLLIKQRNNQEIDLLFYNIALEYLGFSTGLNTSSMLTNIDRHHFFYTSFSLMTTQLWIRKLYKYPFLRLLGLRKKSKSYVYSFLLEYHLLKAQNNT